MLGSIIRRTKFHPVFSQLHLHFMLTFLNIPPFLNIPRLSKSQRKHLESSAICQNKFIPVFKCMQSSRSFYQLITRAQIQMESVRQNQLNLGKISDIFWIFEHIENHSLDGRFCPHRHKNRGCQGDSIERDLSNPCISLLFEYLKFKLIHNVLTRINMD